MTAPPSDPDLAHERDIYCRAEEKRFTEELQRLIGHAWEDATKVITG